MSIPSYISLEKKADDSKFPNFSLEEYLESQKVNFKVRDSRSHKEFSTNCPMCVERGEDRADTKGRLWVNPKKGTFYCYNCHWDGPLVRLIQHYSNASYQAALKILKGRAPNPLEHLSFKLHQEEIDSEEEEGMTEVELPDTYKSFEHHAGESVYTAYLEHRGIPLEYAIEHKWGFCDEGYLANRIVVPSYMEGSLVFWQARDVLDSSHPNWDTKEYRKILNPRGVSAMKVLHNYDHAKDYDEIILCEGFIDVVKVGDNAVATNGKHLHPAQMDMLTKTKAESICILWDHDAHHDERVKKNGQIIPSSVERASDLLRSCFQVRSVKLPRGFDAGDYEIGELDDLIY